MAQKKGKSKKSLILLENPYSLIEMNKHRFSWVTRLRICWCVLLSGNCDLKKYKTIHQQEQWDICRKRDREMQECTRPRTEFPYDDDLLEQ